MTFEFSKEISHSNTFSHEHGFEVGVSVTAKAKIPFVAESEVEVSASTSHNWGYGEENSESTSFTTSSPVSVPGGKVYEGVATIKSTKMTIPYTGLVYFEGTPVTK